MADDHSIQEAQEVLRIEAESILRLVERIGDSFAQAVEQIYRCRGRVIVTGIGKSGLIGRKIVATLTSTGTQALFLHPVEGLHGDLGIVTKEDILLAISHSGETAELNLLLDSIHTLGVKRIAFTGNLRSTLARNCDLVIDVGVEKEACPFGLAPTSSSTAALAMGDALAVALIHRRDFREQDFYKFHPGGSLGSQLRAKVGDVMITGGQIPRVANDASAREAIRELDEKNKGFVLVTAGDDSLAGILTDGDLRRLVRTGRPFLDEPIEAVMTRNPKAVDQTISVAQAIEQMQRAEITTLAVTGPEGRLRGYIHLHDLLGRGGTLRISLSE